MSKERLKEKEFTTKIKSERCTDTESFIRKATSIHGSTYLYNNTIYKGDKEKVCITCRIHGDFWMKPSNHLNGKQGCPRCGYGKMGESHTLSQDKIISQFKVIHGDKYDYSKFNYVNDRTKSIIICPIHGEFKQTPDGHKRGYGCRKCGYNIAREKERLSRDKIISQFKAIHGDKYDYSKFNYVNDRTKSIIICPIHGEFKQHASIHKRGAGCPYCRESRGENVIDTILKQKGITYKRQHRFPDCRDKYPLPFDFYLPDNNICIEFDGEQHFRPVNYYGGIKGFELTQRRDNIKNKYCEEKGIKLIRIPYNKIDEIKEIIVSNTKRSDI